MNKRDSRVLIAVIVLVLFPASVGLMAAGEQVIPHVADGAGVIRTKIDLCNISTNTVISRTKIFFFDREGAPWTVTTNLGTSNQFQLDLGRSQTLRIETSGTSAAQTSGYAVIRSSEFNPAASTDWRVSVSVYYEVLNGLTVTDAVSVPNGQPTLYWMHPAEFDLSKELYSGFALVNLAGADNQVTLQLWASFPVASADASNGGSVTLGLRPNEKRSQFLHESGLFSQKTSFKGVLVGRAEKPVAAVALLQSPTPGGPQYSTLAAEYLDALHTEGLVYLPDSGSLDADVPRVQYVASDDSAASDLYYQFISSEVRKLVPQNGARIAPIGIRSLNELNDLSLEQLRELTYSSDPVDISDVSGRMANGFTFALQTSLGRYAKIRVTKVVQTGYNKDLALQVFIYR